MKTAVVLSIAVLANAFGNVCLSRGMHSFADRGLSGAGWVEHAAAHIFENPWMVAGVLLLIVFLAAYMAALSWADLSFVLPATAPAYILTAILAHYLLHETISPVRWSGTALIVVGTCLIARTLGDSGKPDAAAEKLLVPAETARPPATSGTSEAARLVAQPAPLFPAHSTSARPLAPSDSGAGAGQARL